MAEPSFLMRMDITNGCGDANRAPRLTHWAQSVPELAENTPGPVFPEGRPEARLSIPASVVLVCASKALGLRA